MLAFPLQMAEGGGFYSASLETRCDAIAQIEFGGDSGDVKAVADDTVHERANHARASQDGAAGAVNFTHSRSSRTIWRSIRTTDTLDHASS